MRKRFKKQSDLVKAAINKVVRRKPPALPESEDPLVRMKMRARGQYGQ